MAAQTSTPQRRGPLVNLLRRGYGDAEESRMFFPPSPFWFRLFSQPRQLGSWK